MINVPPLPTRCRWLLVAWFVVFLVAGAFLRFNPANADETIAAKPAVDPMLGTEVGQVRDDNGLKMKLVWCPPGLFNMGVQQVVGDGHAVEGNQIPKHGVSRSPLRVVLTRGYWLGKYEVTQDEWGRLMTTEPWKGHDFTKAGNDYPVSHVSWEASMEFCLALTKDERCAARLPANWEYTLPTEAQWERACRARTETEYSFGNDKSLLRQHAWMGSSAPDFDDICARRVGQKIANPWGLFDMHGNVCEWCRDDYADTLPGGKDPTTIEDGDRKVLRGGSWLSSAPSCQSSARSSGTVSGRAAHIGFRVALVPARSAAVAPAGTAKPAR